MSRSTWDAVPTGTGGALGAAGAHVARVPCWTAGVARRAVVRCRWALTVALRQLCKVRLKSRCFYTVATSVIELTKSAPFELENKCYLD